MNPVDVLQGAVVVLMALAVIISILPSDCRCEKCGFHVNERRMAREEAVVADHRLKHSAFRLPWPSDRCPYCKSGRVGDKPTGKDT